MNDEPHLTLGNVSFCDFDHTKIYFYTVILLASKKIFPVLRFLNVSEVTASEVDSICISPIR